MERPPPAPSNVPPGKRILIVIPVYNERENIVGLLDQLLAIPPALDVLLIEDNSPDGTGAAVDAYSRENPASRSYTGPENSASAPPTSAGSPTPSGTGTTTSSRWTPTTPTTPST